jgi:hypothetical protein
VDPNADDSVASIPAFFDFVLYPLTTCRFRSDENGGDAGVLELIIDPAFDRRDALLFDRFPIGRVDESVLIFTGYDVGVSDLPRPPRITLIVKAEEDLSSHYSHLSLHEIGAQGTQLAFFTCEDLYSRVMQSSQKALPVSN